MRKRRRWTPKWGRYAATLVEVAVAIAAIGLPVVLAVAAGGRARDRTQLDQCLGNLRQIGAAMSMYFQDNDDWFPWARSNDSTIHCFYYGGHPGRPPWWGYIMEYVRDTPGGRPFNDYIYPGLPKTDIQASDPRFDKVRNVPVFRCPADTGGCWSSDPNCQPSGWPLYLETGSSYDCNYHFVNEWARKGDVLYDGPWLQYANEFLRAQLRRYASAFVVIYEDPFDPAQWMRIPKTGWHGELNRHSFLFLDGHAGYVHADTTGTWANRGLGWKTASGVSNWPTVWWQNPSDPDYRYRCIQPETPGCQ